MPELPEVETMRRGIAGVVGARISAVRRTLCRQKPIEVKPRIDRLNSRLQGKVIRETGRAGKRVVLWLGSAEALVIEPRMTGLVLVADPPNVEHLRIRIDLEQSKSSKLYYWDRRGLGNVRLFSQSEFAAEFGPNRLGPDALQMTAAKFHQQLSASKRAIKVALLDQKAVAGIGNLYAAEILHLAGIHPERLCSRMTDCQWEALADANLAILNEAIRYEGSTLSDGTYRNALNKDGSYQNQHRVYGKAGQNCPSCEEGIIQRIVQAQRATFFCQSCQKKSGVRADGR